MPFSLLNGISGFGAGLAEFAGRAGLEQQRSDLAQKQAVLADQLATTRESAGRQEAAGIAATAAEKERGFLGTQSELNWAATRENLGITEAGANTRNAASVGVQYAQIAAGDATRAQEILASQQRTALEGVKFQNEQDLRTAHQALQAEVGKPDADPAKIAGLKSQITSLETSATTEAASNAARAQVYRTDMEAVQHYNQQLVTATAQLNAPEMSDTDRVAQKGLIAELKTQLSGAQRALKYSSDLVHGSSSGGGVDAGKRPSLNDILTVPGADPAKPFNNNAGPRATPQSSTLTPSVATPSVSTSATDVPADPPYSHSGPSNTPPALLRPITPTGVAFARAQIEVMDRIDAGQKVDGSDDVLGYANLTRSQREAMRANLQKTIADAPGFINNPRGR